MTRVAASALYWTKSPFGLASSVALVILSTAAEVAVGEDLLKGHIVCAFEGVLNGVVRLGRV